MAYPMDSVADYYTDQFYAILNRIQKRHRYCMKGQVIYYQVCVCVWGGGGGGGGGGSVGRSTFRGGKGWRESDFFFCNYRVRSDIQDTRIFLVSSTFRGGKGWRESDFFL